MQILNDRKLARRLNEDVVSEKEQFYYFMILLIVSILPSSAWLIGQLGVMANYWDLASDIALIVFTLSGSVWVFNTNASGDNRNFVARYISLGLPVSIQTLIGVIIVALMIFLLEEVFTTVMIQDEASIVDLVLTIVFLSFFYFRLNGAIKIASKTAASQSPKG